MSLGRRVATKCSGNYWLLDDKFQFSHSMSCRRPLSSFSQRERSTILCLLSGFENGPSDGGQASAAKRRPWVTNTWCPQITNVLEREPNCCSSLREQTRLHMWTDSQEDSPCQVNPQLNWLRIHPSYIILNWLQKSVCNFGRCLTSNETWGRLFTVGWTRCEVKVTCFEILTTHSPRDIG